jgi:hypothetical protein
MTILPVPVRSLTHLHASVIQFHLLRSLVVLGYRDIGEARHIDAGAGVPGS